MGSWDWDVATGECQLDAGQYRILGIDPENAQLDLDRAFVHPDDLARIEGLIRQGATTDTNSFQTDINPAARRANAMVYLRRGDERGSGW